VRILPLIRVDLPGKLDSGGRLRGVEAPQAVETTTMQDGFADRLRQLRKQRELSQAELAQGVGLHTNLIGRYERGESRPAADTLKRLAGALGVSSDYLLEGVTAEAAKARFEDRELLEQFQEVERLPAEDKALIKSFLDAFLFKRKVQSMSAR
jgi:transcriptional regulator with XRE-family HTH domain